MTSEASAVNQNREPALLTSAREHGEVDVFAGKRRWVRYNLGMSLEVSTDPTAPSEAWRVTMHNICGGGLGVWSRRAVPSGGKIHIRDCPQGEETVWLPGRVTHSTLGIRGHLIGIAFDDPWPPDAEDDDKPAPAPGDAAERQAASRAHASTQSLRAKCAIGGLITCGSALVVAYALFGHLAGRIGQGEAAAVALAAGSLIGAIVGWMILRQEITFLRALRTALRDTTAGKPLSSQLVGAPCTELGSLARAFQDLGVRWRQREHDERAQRERLEEITRIKTNFLSIVSHDLRTPLTSILLYAEMLKEQLDTMSDEDRRHFIEIVCEECTRLSHLVDDLLEVQRLESDRVRFDLRPRDLAETVNACARLFVPLAEGKSMSLSVQCPPSLPQVEADPDKFAQGLNNLISNALKYTPTGGSVSVVAEARDREVLISVADNGPGIPRDKWDQIFDRFSQLADPDVSQIDGFGLGLYIVSRIVEAHGGRVWVDSEMGRGTAFYVALPVAGSGVPRIPEADLGGATYRVLVCDSDPELTATIAQTVRIAGFDVRVAHSGGRLVQQLDQGDIDVLLTDIALPDMEASELLDALNARAQRGFRTIVHTCDGAGQELRRRGVDVVLRRPVSKDELVHAVRIAVQKRSVAGLTVVLVQNEHLDTDRLGSLLVDAGHMTMLADDVKEAATLAREYGGNLIITSSDSLCVTWEELRDVRIATHGQARVLVLCEAIRKRERHLEEENKVTAVTYRPGAEEQVVDVILESEYELAGSLGHEPDPRL